MKLRTDLVKYATPEEALQEALANNRRFSRKLGLAVCHPPQPRSVRKRSSAARNSESFAAVGEEWQRRRSLEATLGDTLDYLRTCHRRAPFLFFNGNTFSEVARRMPYCRNFPAPVGVKRAHWLRIMWAACSMSNPSSLASLTEPWPTSSLATG